MYTAVIENQNNNCSIKVIRDTSLDEHSSPTVNTDYCQHLKVSANGLKIS